MNDTAAVEKETFNFIARNASSGVLDRLNAFIVKNKACYAPAP